MARPKISVIMVTGKAPERLPFLRAAVRSILFQSYEELELIIVYDTPVQRLDLFAYDDRIIPCWVPPGIERLSLGALRNIGLEKASGQWIAQADDDDWHHPRRLEVQMQHAREKSAVLLLHQIRYSFPNNAGFSMRYDRPSEGIPGTVLHARVPEMRYQEIGKHEDSRFLNDHFGPRRIIINNMSAEPDHVPHLYLRFFHGNNTWDHRHVMRQYADPLKRGARDMPSDSRAYLEQVLASEYEFAKHPLPS